MSNQAPAPDSSANWRDISRPSAARGLILAVAGACAGLLIAGFGLFTSTLIVPPEYVALVNQQPISRVDYVAMLQNLYATDLAVATPEQRRKVLDDLIREELFVQRGKELDVAGVDADVRTAMVNAVERQAAANATSELPTEGQLRAFFHARSEDYASEGTMTVRDLLFQDSATAAQAAAMIRDGRPVDDALKAFKGKDSGKVSGEEFYFAAKIHLGHNMFNIARALPTGGVSPPIQADGIHILAMVKNSPPVPESFESVRSRVLNDYRRDAVTHLQENMERFLRNRANILIAPDLR